MPHGAFRDRVNHKAYCTNMNETIDSVLTYWFGTEQSNTAIAEDRKKIWWGKDDQVDQEIAGQFRELTESVASGDLDHWRDSSKGLLASIICTDQFSRNMYRGSPRSFSYDTVALQLAHQAVGTAMDTALSAIERVFMYLPFEHSEDLENQQKSLELFNLLYENCDHSEKEVFSGYLDYAQRHYDVIKQFGRFPHRNEILGRKSTELENEFLAQPGSSF